MSNIQTITMDNAQALLVEESYKRPVVIDFWADWCAPCKALMPVLESLAQAANGGFLLAKVNADTENHIAAQFGVRSLPTVVIMKDGQPVDGFVGAKTPSEVQAFLDQHLPKAWEAAVGRAQGFLADNNPQEALPLFLEALQQSKQLPSILLAVVDCYLQMNRFDEAEKYLAQVKMVDQDARYEQLKGALALKREAAKTPQLQALEAAFAATPDDLSVRFQLAMQLSQDAAPRQALEHLYEVIKRERNFNEGEALQAYKAIIANLGKGDSLAIEFQRRLFTLLY